MIRATAIRKTFGDLQVLKGVDLHVAKGEVVSIVGASGAGKTTLLQILGTLERADEGSLAINGEVVTKLGSKALSAFRNKHIGFVFQFHHLLPEFTAIENVMMPGLIAGRSMSDCDTSSEAAPGTPQHCRTRRTQARSAERRRATARGRGPGALQQPQRGAGRRTQRQPR